MKYTDVEPIKVPRTIDLLTSEDCIEIILNDLARYGVPDSEVSDFVHDYYRPMKKEIYRLKKEYGEKLYANSPEYIFFD